VNRRKIAVASLLVLAIALVTALAFAKQQHGSQPDHGHAVDPDSHGQLDESAPARGHDKEHRTGHADEHHGPAAINWTDLSDKHRPAFIALVVNFGLLFGLYYTLGKKPIAEGLKQRRITIGKDIEEARDMLAEAKERAKKYQGELKNADADAATAKASLVAAGKGEVEHVLTEANERAERMARDAERLVEQERKQVHQDLLVDTIERAVTAAEKLLERSVTAEDHARLANDLLTELASKPAAARARTTGGAA
jgi:F-type H+-transporting ATPase subunit b